MIATMPVRLEKEWDEPWLGSFFLASSAGLAVLDPDLRFIRINETLAAANGVPVRDHIGRSIHEVIPDLAKELEPILRRVVSTGTPVLDAEVSGKTHSEPQRVHHWSVSYFPLAMFPGGPPGVGVVAVEITGRKEAEALLLRQQQELQQSEQLWRSVFAAAHDGILVHDAEFHVLACNDTAERMYGYSASELTRMDLRVLHGEFAELEVRLRSAALQDSPHWETLHRRRDGTLFAVEVSIRAFTLAGEPRFVQMVRDITERKNAERQIRFQASLLGQVRNAVVAVDLEGRTIYWNRFAETLFQWKASEALGRNAKSLTVASPGLALAASVRRVVHQGMDWEGEMLLHRKDGSQFPGWVATTPLRDDRGTVIGVVGVSIDISQGKRAEEDLRRSREQLRLLAMRLDSVREEEARRISREVHDALGQQLTALKLDLQHLETNLPRGKKALARQCERMQALLDRTIEAAQKISSELRLGHLDVVGLAEAMTWHLREFARRTGIVCRTTRVTEVVDVDHGTATVAFRIFQEAVTNVARHARATILDLALYEENGWLVLVIQDNGCGISPERLNHPQAIGLLGMRERAESVGGAVKVESGPEGGTTVTATLPRVAVE